jgi:hypothetical protein
MHLYWTNQFIRPWYLSIVMMIELWLSWTANRINMNLNGSIFINQPHTIRCKATIKTVVCVVVSCFLCFCGHFLSALFVLVITVNCWKLHGIPLCINPRAFICFKNMRYSLVICIQQPSPLTFHNLHEAIYLYANLYWPCNLHGNVLCLFLCLSTVKLVLHVYPKCCFRKYISRKPYFII